MASYMVARLAAAFSFPPAGSETPPAVPERKARVPLPIRAAGPCAGTPCPGPGHESRKVPRTRARDPVPILKRRSGPGPCPRDLSAGRDGWAVLRHTASTGCRFGRCGKRRAAAAAGAGASAARATWRAAAGEAAPRRGRAGSSPRLTARLVTGIAPRLSALRVRCRGWRAKQVSHRYRELLGDALDECAVVDRSLMQAAQGRTSKAAVASYERRRGLVDCQSHGRTRCGTN